MRKLKRAALIVALSLTSTSVYAEGQYLGFSAGLQFDLASLGNTIAVDGLGAGPTYPGGNRCVQGNRACTDEGPSGTQNLIVAENELIALEKSTAGAVRSKTSGPMTGLALEVFYEREFESTFIRIGVQYVDKVLGGSTESEVLKGTPFAVKWFDIEWDYYAWHIPFYWGLKVNVGENGSVYGGLGINYSEGGWNVGGTNNGDVVNQLLGLNTGIRYTTDSVTGAVVQVPVVDEAARFRVKSILPNFVIGVETKLAGGDKLFFEMEQILGGGYGVSPVKSEGGAKGLAPIAAYPASLSGTRWKFGYKLAL